jgi:formylglycine-generating enzyme required for sulfatase activity
VAGGATVIGAIDPTSNAELSAMPVRVLGLSRFFLDRHEVSVARFRQALSQGFAPAMMPFANEGPLTATPTGYCTWSASPLGREDYALNCVQWELARDFCTFSGGDLPTEVQWEHAATIAGRGRKARYPWGDDPPTCDRAAYGRISLGGQPAECASKGSLTPPPGDSAADLSPLGINALGGGVQEWVLDAAQPYTGGCWGDSPVVDPRCGDPGVAAASRIFRGSSFLSPMVPGMARWKQDPLGGFGPIGFRCAYPEAGP